MNLVCDIKNSKRISIAFDIKDNPSPIPAVKSIVKMCIKVICFSTTIIITNKAAIIIRIPDIMFANEFNTKNILLIIVSNIINTNPIGKNNIFKKIIDLIPPISLYYYYSTIF